MTANEVGSFFSLDGEVVAAGSRGGVNGEVPAEWQLANSGRAALTSILAFERDRFGLGTVWVPSYYCSDITSYIGKDFRVRTYPADPIVNAYPQKVDEHDRVVVVSYFGARPPRNRLPMGQVILDVSHDPTAPWIPAWQAGWVFGSLRKTLPLPEGAFALSGDLADDLDLRQPSPEALERTRSGLRAMRDKASWLSGKERTPAKEIWYESLQTHESAFAGLSPSALGPSSSELLHAMPIGQWRDIRISNLRCLTAGLAGTRGIRLLPSTFGLVAVFQNPQAADSARSRLISERIYPAKLWPHPVSMVREHDLAARMVFLHTDHRYANGDMRRVSAVLVAATDDQTDRGGGYV